MKKTLLILGGGINQVPIVKVAKELDLRTVVCSITPESPCKEISDHYEQVDITDKHAVLEIAKKHRVDGVLADQVDWAVPTAAYVAESIGLKSIGYEIALRFTNKLLMRQNLREKLPFHTPAFTFFDELELALKFCRETSQLTNYVVKPINSQGSRGVYHLHTDNFKPALTNAFQESHGRGVLIEEYIHGNEYSVESYNDNGNIHNLAITKKYHYDHNECLDEKNTWLGDIDSELENELFELNKKIINALGLPFGISHAEFKIHNGKAYLIEIAARGGGGSISNKVIPYLTGFVPVRAHICNLLGFPYSVKVEDYKKKFAILRFFNFKHGKVKKIHLNKNAISDLIHFQLDIKDGDSIGSNAGSIARNGFFVICGENRQEILEKEKWILESVILEYEK